MEPGSAGFKQLVDLRTQIAVCHGAGMIEGDVAVASQKDEGGSGAGAVEIEVRFADGNGDPGKL